MPVNIGNPDEISMLDFAKEILDLTNNKVSIIFKPLPVDDPKQQAARYIKGKGIIRMGAQGKSGRRFKDHV